MTVKTKIILILFGLLVVSLIIIFFGIKYTMELRSQRNEMFDNLNSVKNEIHQVVYVETEKQLRKLYPKFDSLAKSMGVKNITQVHNTYYKYEYGDTLITPLLPNPEDPEMFDFTIDTACLKIEGIVDVRNKQLIHNSIKLADEITEFYYRQRMRLFDWKWTPRWGRWQYKAVIHSNCSDSIRTEQITIKNHSK